MSLGAILKSDSVAERRSPPTARFGCLGSAGRIGMVNGFLILPKRDGAGAEQPPLRETHEGMGPENGRFPNIRCSVQPSKGSACQGIAQLAIVLGGTQGMRQDARRARDLWSSRLRMLPCAGALPSASAVRFKTRYDRERTIGERSEVQLRCNFKRPEVDGVRHEIDIFVTIDLGQEYKSVFIFECKNWKAAVDKNEIIILSEKIKATAATHGYLVAKSFTKDAEAQAATDPRLTLWVASEHDPTASPLPIDLHSIITISDDVELTFRKRGTTGDQTKDLVVGDRGAMLHGAEINLREYVGNWTEQLIASDVLKFRTEKLPEGDYSRTVDSERRFELGELAINDDDMEQATVAVRYTVRVLRPAVVSYFEVASRGRCRLLEPIPLPTGETGDWLNSNCPGKDERVRPAAVREPWCLTMKCCLSQAVQ